MKQQGALVLVLVFLSVVSATRWFELHGYTFEDYVSEFDKMYTPEEYQVRKEIFQKNLEAIWKHNKDPTKTWKEGVNKYTDATEAEWTSLRGYKKIQSSPSYNYNPSLQTKAVPTAVDWRSKGIVTSVKDQASCGSCWTFAAAEALESQWAKRTGNLTVLSEQQILDCTPNPQQCGGGGGCEGGTAELAYERLIQLGGLTSEALYPYASGGGRNYKCKSPLPTPVAKLVNYTKLPENEYQPLLDAVANVGPIAISVDANAWGRYESGVFDGCDKENPDIDHAVILDGYGTDPVYGDYWLVRNSWGARWGEKGYIRLARSSEVKCGIDTNPGDGSGCAGGPPQVTVCGTCGILYDTCYPIV